MQRECEAILACSQQPGEDGEGGGLPDAAQLQQLGSDAEQHGWAQQAPEQLQLGHGSEQGWGAGPEAMQLDGQPQPGRAAGLPGSPSAAEGLQAHPLLGAVSPLPFSLSPAMAMQPPAAAGPWGAAAPPGAAAAAAGDIEDAGRPWAQQQQQRKQQQQGGGMPEEQEDEDAVYLQALQAYEQQQAQQAQQQQQAQQAGQQQTGQQQAQQQQQQQPAAGEPRVPQVDGAADSGIESAEEGDSSGAGSSQVG